MRVLSQPKRLAVILLLAMPGVPSASAATQLPPFEPGESAEVRSVVDGNTLMLDDGRTVRLVGIEAPPPAVGRNRRGSAFAAAAKAALEKLVIGRKVELRFAGSRRDRHGRVLAQLFVGKRWVQAELLRRGLARVESTADNRLGVSQMLAHESRARQARRGIWRASFYAVRQADEAGRYAGSFQLVEGVVVDIAHVEDQLFLNFGEDWRHSFSLRLGPEALRLFRAEGIDPARFKGARLRLRGWIHGVERPIIDITHPEQIEQP